jgi:hypothetical protein
MPDEEMNWLSSNRNAEADGLMTAIGDGRRKETATKRNISPEKILFDEFEIP